FNKSFHKNQLHILSYIINLTFPFSKTSQIYKCENILIKNTKYKNILIYFIVKLCKKIIKYCYLW
ncbi:hypothetical protein DVA85_27580, partial [Acinetobacter sp. RIT592]